MTTYFILFFIWVCLAMWYLTSLVPRVIQYANWRFGKSSLLLLLTGSAAGAVFALVSVLMVVIIAHVV